MWKDILSVVILFHQTIPDLVEKLFNIRTEWLRLPHFSSIQIAPFLL
jgi:hypothetical protein